MQSWTSTPRHKVFISFHHAGDYRSKELFLARFGETIIDYSVRTGEIPDNAPTEYVRQKIRDEYIRDATVTIVLIGPGTWRRKHVDWEIYSSLRATEYNSRMGLLGILLPSYRPPNALTMPPSNWGSPQPQLTTYHTVPTRETYWPNNIPPRLWDNVRATFARVRPWPAYASELQDWIHEAFQRRDQNPSPNLARSMFSQNRPETQAFWSD
jgi:hypothetical protein